MDDYINYEIVDGQCSYCGYMAKMIQLPDGSIEASERCEHCDEYNLDVLTDSTA
jgi:hypothetical protein